MLLWVIFACLAAGAILAVSSPLFRKAEAAAPSLPEDAEVYAAQLTEMDRDLDRGLLSSREAEEARAEIARRLLKTKKTGAGGKAAERNGGAAGNRSLAFGAIAGFVSLVSLGAYLALGRPDLPEQPLAARLQGSPDSLPLDALVARVEQRLTEHPEDGMGWTVIAPIYLKERQFDKAADAYRRSIRLTGETAEKLLGLGEALTYEAEGMVTKDAADAFGKALAREPSSIRARFWLAMRDEQSGDKAKAESAYNALLNEPLPQGWKPILQSRLALLQSAPVKEKPGTAQQPSTKRDEAASSGDGLKPEFIRSMVEGLAGRLKQDGSDLNGWLMLVRSYVVLGETDKAKDAYASAKGNFKDQPEALRKLDDLARQLGLS
jgi:cytochrome c-type biogenesis protein CcmH